MDNDKQGENKKAIFSSYLQNINLKEIFSERDLDQILSEFNTIDDNLFMNKNSPKIFPQKSVKDVNINSEAIKKCSNSKKVNEILINRTEFILKTLKLSCIKLKMYRLDYLAKGIEW